MYDEYLSFDYRRTKLAERKFKQRDEWVEKNKKFTEMQSTYESKIDDSFSLFDFDLVVYDEIEYFRDYTHDLFDYPFQPRKIKLSTFSFDADPSSVDETTGEYNYN